MTDTQNQIVGDIKGNIDSLKNPDFKKMLDPKTQSSLDPNPKSDYKSNYVVNPPTEQKPKSQTNLNEKVITKKNKTSKKTLIKRIFFIKVKIMSINTICRL